MSRTKDIVHTPPSAHFATQGVRRSIAAFVGVHRGGGGSVRGIALLLLWLVREGLSQRRMNALRGVGANSGRMNDVMQQLEGEGYVERRGQVSALTVKGVHYVEGELLPSIEGELLAVGRDLLGLRDGL